jgi:hypothetical protein
MPNFFWPFCRADNSQLHITFSKLIREVRMLTRIHMAALAIGTVGMCHLMMTPVEAKEPAQPTGFINPFVVLYPSAGEWNCSQQTATHWCHRRLKRRPAS